MKILITGVGGFLGGWLARSLTGHELTGVYHRTKPDLDINLFHAQNLPKENFDVIMMCHAAISAGSVTLDADALYQGNVVFTQKILDAYPGIPVVYVSTVSVFPVSDEIKFEKSATNPQSQYAQTKLDAENLVLAAAPSAIVRLSSLYGTGMKDGTLIPNYVGQALAKGEIEVWGDGSRPQNYIHVSDAARLITAVAESGIFDGDIFMAVAQKSNSNLEVAQLIAKNTGASIKFVNNDTSVGAVYDNSLTLKSVNWRPEMSLDDGLSDYIQWKKKQF